LTTLTLTTNEVGDRGFQLLANAIQNNKTLKTLKLEANQIGNQGTEYLANALQKNQVK
jgi:Ran GTPase-activating protein (RanGAP) involved in mRNA processing and transport